MILRKVVLVLFVVSVQSDDSALRSSLTMVIDDTGSMSDEIRQVKDGAKSIFDTVTNSNVSQIEDFVLVTFNDPEVEHRITTKDYISYKHALESISVNGGGDCPEECLKGIELALEKSRPGSLLFVFTDASSLHYDIYPRVKALAQKKMSQITFVLTGLCTDRSDPGYKAYEGIAKATYGQVFHLTHKGEIHKVLKSVEDSITSRKTVIASHDFPPGPHEFSYEVDGTMKELVISVSGTDASVSVIGPDGGAAATEDVLRTSNIAVVKVKEVKPGVYKAEVNSKSETSVLVSGSTSVHFQYGFAQFKPTSIADTATRPLPDVSSFVAIKLTTEGADVRLDTLQIRDMDDEIVTEVPFKVTSDKKNQFFVTEKIELPKTTFKIAIKGYDLESKTVITRISLTPIEPQIIEKAINTAPKVTVIGADKLYAEYEEPLELKCKINAQPKPSVVWEDSDGNKFPSTPVIVELPSDFVTVFSIDSVKNNRTYKCLARNEHGEDSKEISVETMRITYLDIVQRPKSTDVAFNEEAKFTCKVDANPPASIQWYINDRPVRTDSNIEITPDNTVMIIHRMKPEYEGQYTCAVKNGYENHALSFYVGVTGTEAPLIDKTMKELQVLEGASEIDLSCRILEGKPKPEIRWHFQHAPGENVEIGENSEILTLTKITREMSGTYRCEASNGVSSDYHFTDVIVEYPPTIKKEKPALTVRQADRVRISCRTDGIPEPEVKWFINDTEVEPPHFRVHRYHSLNFKAATNDTGLYRCQATNKHGTANEIKEVTVIIPPHIPVPEETQIDVIVGDDVTLRCHAEGLPKPTIKWTFYSSKHPRNRPHGMKPSDPSGALTLRRVQPEREGFYKCQANSVGGMDRITFEVRVLAPPQIKDSITKTFHGVVGDRVLRIPCVATGNPEPDIVWTQPEIGKIAAGTDWYDVDESGTLVLKNLDKESAGKYICEARNRLGSKTAVYEVVVDNHPKIGTPTREVLIEEGSTKDVECKVPHTITDSLRWYKGGNPEADRELRINSATTADTGVYTCRVSSFEKSRDSNVQITVGYQPRFLYDKDRHIEYQKDQPAFMDCTAEGVPEPDEVSWWNSGSKIPFDGMVYELRMTDSSVGVYTCLVKNSFGQSMRQFEISSRDCMLDMKKDFEEKPPLLLATDLTWPKFNTSGTFIKIPTGESVIFHCPDGFENFPSTETVVKCGNQNKFNYMGTSYEFAKFKCRKEIEPTVEDTGENCVNDLNSIYSVGYKVRGRFLEVYNICFDTYNKMPVYAEQIMSKNIANVGIEKKKWIHNSLTPYDFDNMYDCDTQLRTVSAMLGRWFHQDDKCCFKKQQLVSSKNVLPGSPQTATQSHVNLVPQWSTCHTKNWDKVEQLIRDLVKSSPRELKVWTGTAQQLQMSGRKISIVDQYSRQQPVPTFLWKVVQDPAYQESVAIVHVNVPDLSPSDAETYILCRDLCSDIEWMSGRSWRDTSNGFIYCCNIREFEEKFDFKGVFNSGVGKVLYKILE